MTVSDSNGAASTDKVGFIEEIFCLDHIHEMPNRRLSVRAWAAEDEGHQTFVSKVRWRSFYRKRTQLMFCCVRASWRCKLFLGALHILLKSVQCPNCEFCVNHNHSKFNHYLYRVIQVVIETALNEIWGSRWLEFKNITARIQWKRFSQLFSTFVSKLCSTW